jgi:hypothetical protein
VLTNIRKRGEIGRHPGEDEEPGDRPDEGKPQA